MTDMNDDPAIARERLAMTLDDSRALVAVRVLELRRCLDRGLSWGHETVRTARARLVAALADVQVLELLTRPVAPLEAPVPGLITRGKPR